MSTQKNFPKIKNIVDVFCSPFVYIGELFADIFKGGKSFSYRVSSDITSEEVCILHTAILNQEIFPSSKIQNSFSGRKVSILAPSNSSICQRGSISSRIDEETGFLLCDTEGGEIEW